MTGEAVPGRNALRRAGVRWRVAGEYRRLLLAGVNPCAAVVLARGRRAARGLSGRVGSEPLRE
jgi:hypothetical protein